MMSLWEGMGITEDEYYELMKPPEILMIAKGKLKVIMKSDFQKNNKLSDKKEADKKFKEEYDEYRNT